MQRLSRRVLLVGPASVPAAGSRAVGALFSSSSGMTAGQSGCVRRGLNGLAGVAGVVGEGSSGAGRLPGTVRYQLGEQIGGGAPPAPQGGGAPPAPPGAPSGSSSSDSAAPPSSSWPEPPPPLVLPPRMLAIALSRPLVPGEDAYVQVELSAADALKRALEAPRSMPSAPLYAGLFLHGTDTALVRSNVGVVAEVLAVEKLSASFRVRVRALQRIRARPESNSAQTEQSIVENLAVVPFHTIGVSPSNHATQRVVRSIFDGLAALPTTTAGLRRAFGLGDLPDDRVMAIGSAIRRLAASRDVPNWHLGRLVDDIFFLVSSLLPLHENGVVQAVLEERRVQMRLVQALAVVSSAKYKVEHARASQPPAAGSEGETPSVAGGGRAPQDPPMHGTPISPAGLPLLPPTGRTLRIGPPSGGAGAGAGAQGAGPGSAGGGAGGGHGGGGGAGAGAHGRGAHSRLQAQVEKYMDRLRGKVLPDSAKQLLREEFERLETLEHHNSEMAVIMSWLDVMSSLPWERFSDDVLDLARAEEVMNRDHYGMKEIKDRLLEFIAMSQLRGQGPDGKILCLVGPPGTGKTSITRALAESLGREYVRIALGGVDDVNDIKGHRRTYLGSMPGLLINSLRRVSTSNPVILLDEIDKVGQHSYRGSPSNALLEVLDPEQNHSFVDFYLNCPYNLSRVLFVCTANSLDRLPRMLVDRMEVVECRGYSPAEKVAIAKRFMLPKLRAATKFGPRRLRLTDGALHELAEEYEQEAGVRVLGRNLDKIFRKAAVRFLRDPTKPDVSIVRGGLAEWVGLATRRDHRPYKTMPPGVVCGLVARSDGTGGVTYIEVVDLPRALSSSSAAVGGRGGSGGRSRGSGNGRGSKRGGGDGDEDGDGDGDGDGQSGGSEIQVTGSIGDVLEESSIVARSLARRVLHSIDPTDQFFERQRLHMHFPDGAMPKDGPSAGLAITTALLSQALGVPVRHGLGITGEVTLHGHALPVGGIRSKLLGAKTAGLKAVAMPEANRPHYEELDNEIKADIEVHFCSSFEQLFQLAFGKTPAQIRDERDASNGRRRRRRGTVAAPPAVCVAPATAGDATAGSGEVSGTDGDVDHEADADATPASPQATVTEHKYVESDPVR